MNKALQRLLAVAFAAALLLSLAATLPVAAAEEYSYYSIFDADVDAAPSVVSDNTIVEIIDGSTMANEGSNVLKITRRTQYNGITVSWTGDFSTVAPQSLGIRVWVSGDANAQLKPAFDDGGGGIGFGLISQTADGPQRVYVDGTWDYVSTEVTTDGAWYTLVWDGQLFKSVNWVQGASNIQGSGLQSAVVDAEFLSGLQSVHLCFGMTNNITYAKPENYIGTSFYADDIQFLMPAGSTPEPEPQPDPQPQPTDGSRLSFGLNNSAFSMSVDGAETVINADSTETVKDGTAVTLTAQSAGNEFLFWVEDGKVRSAQSQYAFFMNGARNVNAVFAPANGSIVIYRNDTEHTKQVVAYETYQSAELFTDHLADAAAMYGKSFTGWDKSVEDIKALIGAQSVIEVNPVYTDLAQSYTVTVQGGTVTDGAKESYSTGDKLTVTAAIDSFSYWADDTGAVISTNAAFVYTVSNRNTVLTAVADATPDSASSLTVENDNGTLKIYHSFYLPENCTLVDAGLIYSKTALATDPVLADVDGTTVKATHLGATGGNSQTVLNTMTAAAAGVTLRGYIIYTAADGTTQTLYSSTYGGI